MRHGDQLLPSQEGAMPGYVYMTTDPLPHHTITGRILPSDWLANSPEDTWKPHWNGNWWVYEVKPGKEIMWGDYEMELGAKDVKILRNVGNAKGILGNYLRRIRSRQQEHKDMYDGSVVNRNVNIHGHTLRGRGRYFTDEELGRKSS